MVVRATNSAGFSVGQTKKKNNVGACKSGTDFESCLANYFCTFLYPSDIEQDIF